jgi:hypothetical protein
MLGKCNATPSVGENSARTEISSIAHVEVTMILLLYADRTESRRPAPIADPLDYNDFSKGR